MTEIINANSHCGITLQVYDSAAHQAALNMLKGEAL